MSRSNPCRLAGSQNADLGQQESHANATGFPDRVVNNFDRAEGQWGRSNTGQEIRKQRGRSPQRHGAENLLLAVSFRHLIVLLC